MFSLIQTEGSNKVAGRPIKFTVERIDQIKNLVERGKSREEIAEIIGCTVGSLQVTCSRLGISLQRPRFDNGYGHRMTNGDNGKKHDGPAPVQQQQQEQKPVEPAKPEPRSSIAFSIEMEYRGIKRVSVIKLTEEQLGMLALEAEIRDMRLGELIALLIQRTVERGLLEEILK
jgi:hypothetical protein